MAIVEEFFSGSWELEDREFVAVFKALTHASDMSKAADIIASNMGRNWCAALAGAMRASPHSSVKMDMVAAFCPHIQDFSNVALVFRELTHASDMAKCAKLFGAQTPGGLPARALVQVLECTPHASTKMDIIESVQGHVYGDTACIIEHLTHSSDKEKARKMLGGAGW